MIDMDRDGLKELIVTKNYYPKQNPRVEELDILKYIKGGLCCIGSGDYTNFGYLYNKKTKRIHGLWGNCGSIQDWYLTFGKSGLKRVYLSAIEERVVNGKPVYSYSYAREDHKEGFLEKETVMEQELQTAEDV
jgi:hypothetical protein